jgi:hypothetical protein
MTLASRLDTTCYVLFGYSYRKISEAFFAPFSTRFMTSTQNPPQQGDQA